MVVEVRRVRASEGDALRAVRLAALADTPSAFGSTLAAEAAYPPDRWQERAQAAEAGVDSVTFFALDGSSVVGLVGGYREPGAADEAVELVSMWVAPSHRGTGTGHRLVEAVVDWARSVGAAGINLWVTRGNDPAERLYRSLGFEPTGDVAPLPSDPCKDELRMARRFVVTGR